jgi:hypothetical protein
VLDTIDRAIETLREYRESTDMTDLGVCADHLADSMEALLRSVTSRDPVMADVIDKYFLGVE